MSFLTRIGVSVALCVVLYPLFLVMVFTGVNQILTLNGLSAVFSLEDFRFQVLASHWPQFTQTGAPNPKMSLALVGLTAFLAFAFRSNVAFIFFLFHFALATLSSFLDSFYFAPLPDRFLLVGRAATFSFVIVFLSQLAFLAFHTPTVAGTIRLVWSVFLSSVAIALGCSVLGYLAMVCDGTLLIFVTYIILSYGVFGLHVACLTLLLHDPAPRTAGVNRL